MDEQKFKYYVMAVTAILGGFIVHLSLGGVYTIGSMFPYILEYMKNSTSNQFDTAWILSMATFGRSASMTLGGYIESKLGCTLTILLGGGVMSIGYILTYLSIHIHIVLVAITYGLIVGLGTGVAYGVAMTIPSEWFPNHRGLVSGIILAGFGIGSLCFDLIQAYFINPHVSDVKSLDSSKVPLSFIIMGCIYFIIQIVGIPLIRKPKQTINENLSDRELSIFSESRKINMKPHQLIFISKFWIIWMSFALNSVVSFLFLFLQKMWGKRLGISDSDLLISTSIGGVFSILGRVLWGFLADKYGYKITVRTLTLSVAVMFGTFFLCSKLDVQNGKGCYAMYSIWVYALFFLLSGNFSIFPTVCVKAFGADNYTGNFGVLFTGYSFSGIVTSIVVLKLYNASTKTSEYLFPFLVGSIMSILSFIVSLFYNAVTGKIAVSFFM